MTRTNKFLFLMLEKFSTSKKWHYCFNFDSSSRILGVSWHRCYKCCRCLSQYGRNRCCASGSALYFWHCQMSGDDHHLCDFWTQDLVNARMKNGQNCLVYLCWMMRCFKWEVSYTAVLESLQHFQPWFPFVVVNSFCSQLQTQSSICGLRWTSGDYCHFPLVLPSSVIWWPLLISAAHRLLQERNCPRIKALINLPNAIRSRHCTWMQQPILHTQQYNVKIFCCQGHLTTSLENSWSRNALKCP